MPQVVYQGNGQIRVSPQDVRRRLQERTASAFGRCRIYYRKTQIQMSIGTAQDGKKTSDAGIVTIGSIRTIETPCLSRI